MHRKKTRLAERANGVAAALERRGVPRRLTHRLRLAGEAAQYRGIVTTYRAHDRLLSNAISRRRIERQPPVLDEIQRRIVDDLDRRGYALTSFTELFGDDGLWARLDEERARFVADSEAAISGRSAHVSLGHAAKEFLVRKYGYEIEPGLDAPWFETCVSRRMVDLANAYLRLWCKLEYVDLWYSVPQPGAERAFSQLWHRDINDRHLLKAFLYLVDVDDETGPFEYVAGSQPGGPHARHWPWVPMLSGRVAEERLHEAVPGDDIKTFTGPKGTMIFCNTSGLHRGGFATGRPRVLATVTYCSPASLASLTERNYRLPREAVASFQGAQRYAVT